jgi:hypothetical protein
MSAPGGERRKVSGSVSGRAAPELGKYQLLRRLAIGGMAEIFVARSTGIEGFEKLVVLKRILPQYAQDARFIRMFLQEARIAASLQHTNIAQVYDIGQLEGTYFFAMEYVLGVDLRMLLAECSARGERIPVEHAVSIAIDVAAGLHYAHEKRGPDGERLGLVHRDVSPSNILCGYDGSVKVTDFGIAKATFQRGETRPGTVMGKVAYMSPEQCRAKPLDRRSDIFSLGILLYELSTGVHLFNGDGELDVMRQIVDDPIPPPRTRFLDYPEPLERIVMRALQKRPDDRYQTAQDFQAELEAFARNARLGKSALALARYLEQRFGQEVDAWNRAQRAGMSLADFVVSTKGHDTDETVSMLGQPSDPSIELAVANSIWRADPATVSGAVNANSGQVDTPTGSGVVVAPAGSFTVRPPTELEPAPVATPETTASVRRRSRPWLIGVVAALAASGLTLVVLRYQSPAPPASAPATTIPTAEPAPAKVPITPSEPSPSLAAPVPPPAAASEPPALTKGPEPSAVADPAIATKHVKPVKQRPKPARGSKQPPATKPTLPLTSPKELTSPSEL